MRALPGVLWTTGALAPRGKSNDDWLADHWLVVLAQAYYSRHYTISETDIYQQNVILIVMDDAIEQCDQFRMSLLTQPTLEHRQLQPFAVAIHDVEDATPPFLIADVIGHDVEMFFLHG